MSQHLIVWQSPETRGWCVEWYGCEKSARKDLKKFKKTYPWNAYYLTELKAEVWATKKWPGEKQMTWYPAESFHD